MTTPDQPDDLDAFIAEQLKDPEFAKAWDRAAMRDWRAAYERGVAEGLKRAATAIRAQAGLPDLVHFDRPSDFRKGVLTCLAALESLAGKTAEEAPDA